MLQYIYNIYIHEFEDKKQQLPEDEQDSLKIEDIFDENDKKLIEELSKFMEWYQIQQYWIQQQKQEIEA